MDAKILALQPFDKDVKVTVTGRHEPPAVREDAGDRGTVRSMRKGSRREIGFELAEHRMTGGGSDGNFTAALGSPRSTASASTATAPTPNGSMR